MFRTDIKNIKEFQRDLEEELIKAKEEAIKEPPGFFDYIEKEKEKEKEN
ncbi:hypothetical protein [Bacillus arachidis]|nr:hypothetical protein [Bacillus arachidis]WIY58997.1 hypothetical protein QRY57_01565 [Bacillus arachidis]